MPKRLFISIILTTIVLAWAIPHFIVETAMMEFTTFHWLLIVAYLYMIASYYHTALTDLKDRWK